MKPYDFLVVGTGIAGLSFALRVAEKGRVALLTKRGVEDTSTNRAQGGIAAVFAPDDTFDAHIQDTLSAGAGLCHRDRVELLVKNGPQAIRDLKAWGARFSGDREEEGALRFDLGREGGHTRHRIVHAKDFTGQEVERALLTAVSRHPSIETFTRHTCVDLATEHHLGEGGRGREGNSCFGVYAYDGQRQKVALFPAKVTLLASGGVGQVFRHTTNPEIATGDGLAIAYRAGAKIANLEFMQFHPTTLYHPKAKSFLITEALRGHGAKLRNRAGHEFMARHHPMGAMAPRDVVARAIDLELKEKGEPCVYLDATALDAEELKRRFPNIYGTCLNFGIDLTHEPIPVVPAAHYMCGGIMTDEWGRTSLPRLFASGEVAHTGVHGANRLASNSLLEAVVFSSRAVQKAVNLLPGIGALPALPEWDDSGTLDPKLKIALVHDRQAIQSLMWDFAGLVRSDLLLNRALSRLEKINAELEAFYKRTKVSEDLLEVRNLAQAAWMMVRCALARKESRGLHYNIDHPERDDVHYLEDTVL